MKTKQTLALLCSVLLLCTACGSEAGTMSTASSEKVTEEKETEAQETEALIKAPDIPAEDYGGYEFTVLTTDIAENETAYHEIFSEGENGEPVNDAVWKRNGVLEDKYNIKMNGVFFGLFNFDPFKKAVLANEDVYDYVFLNIVTAMSSAVSGYLYEIHEVPYLDFEKPWWLGNSVTEASVSNRSYFAVGDVNLASYESTPVIFFNKQMAADNDITDLYEVVDSGSWTYDKMIEYCSSVGSDLDGDGVLGENDRYGLALNGFSVFTMTYGGGFRMIEKDADDLPYLNISEAFLSYLQKHITTVAENSSILNGDTIAKGDILRGVEIRKKAFQENRVLFYNEMLTMATMLRNMETDFGILPMPKSDVSQKQYYSFFHNSNSSTVTVPVTNGDLDRTGRILEDLLYQSYLLVRPAYFEKTVTAKMMRDETSERMLDLILSNIIFDDALEPGVLDGMRTMFNKANENLASALESKRESYEKKLEKIITAYTES